MGRLIATLRERLAGRSFAPYLLVLGSLIPLLVMVWLPGYPRTTDSDVWGISSRLNTWPMKCG